MSQRNKKMPFVQVDSRIKPSLTLGHAWVYADAIQRTSLEINSGDWVRVQCGNIQLYGIWDADSPIAIRLFSSRQRPDRAWVQKRVERAWEIRSPLRQPDVSATAYRWLYGECDGLPGIVVDLYGDCDTGQQWAMLRSYSKSVDSVKRWVVDSLPAVVPLAGIVERDGTTVARHYGEMPPDSVMISEHGVRFEVDLLRGQKTGFFLDQRENRRTIGQWSQGRRVLNLFSYTGGFSVQAALCGATSVTSVDSAAPAMATAMRNFQHNELDPSLHEFVVADCFEILEKYYAEGRRFDLIIVDPPSFARSKAQLDNALNAYRRLNRLAMQCLAPGGLLASSSCTSQVNPDAFRQMLAEAAADAGHRALILHEAGQSLDHPVPVYFPEGRYLKFVLMAVEPRL